MLPVCKDIPGIMNIAPKSHFEKFLNCFPDPFLKNVKNLPSTAVGVNDQQRIINSFSTHLPSGSVGGRRGGAGLPGRSRTQAEAAG